MDETGSSFQISLQAQYRRAYGLAALAMGGLFLALAPVRYYWPRDPATTGFLAVESALAGLAFLALWFLIRRFRVGQIENLGLLLLGLTALHNAILQFVLQSPHQAANYLPGLVVSGMAFRSRWRFILAESALVGAWLAVCLLLPSPLKSLRWLPSIATGAVIGTVLHLAFTRILAELHRLRIHDHILLQQRSRLIHDLRGTLEREKTLRGLIPICAQCKKVRDDSGYWQQVEHYVAERSGAEFTHGLCPACAEAFRAEFRPSKAQPASCCSSS